MKAAAGKYARAFADVVIGRQLDAARTVEEVRAFAALIAGSAELRTVLENPSVAAKQKLALLDALTSRLGVSRYVRNFAALLVDNHRIAAIAEIARQFALELDDRLGFAQADVTTARDLDDAERNLLIGHIERLTSRKVRAQYARDPKLLGGAVVRLGSTVYDGSVRGQLQRLKEHIRGE
ncbi:MAG: ATP synthase F1 subunit delta [Terriglobales bacterium]